MSSFYGHQMSSMINPSAVAVLLAMFGISPNIPRDPVKEGRTYQK